MTREEFRHISYVGLYKENNYYGLKGYLEAVDYLVETHK